VTQAKDRGIDVTVILDADQSKQTNKEVLKKLYKKGIKVGMNTHQGTMHHKFMLIDDETLVHGSLNWTKAAFAKNDDLFMIVEKMNPDQLVLINKLYQNLENNAKWITEEDWLTWLAQDDNPMASI